MSSIPVRAEHADDLPLPSILITDPDLPILQRALKNDFPDFNFELCSTSDQAESKLQAERYQVVICNVRIAGLQDFSLLKMNSSGHMAVPFLITARIHDKALAYQALKHGALDCILKPMTNGHAAYSVRRAISLYKLRTTMAYTKQMLVGFKKQRTALSIDSTDRAEQRQLVDRHVEKTLSSCQRSIIASEKSLQLLNSMAYDLEQQARHQALERLDALEL